MRNDPEEMFPHQVGSRTSRHENRRSSVIVFIPCLDKKTCRLQDSISSPCNKQIDSRTRWCSLQISTPCFSCDRRPGRICRLFCKSFPWLWLEPPSEWAAIKIAMMKTETAKRAGRLKIRWGEFAFICLNRTKWSPSLSVCLCGIRSENRKGSESNLFSGSERVRQWWNVSKGRLCVIRPASVAEDDPPLQNSRENKKHEGMMRRGVGRRRNGGVCWGCQKIPDSLEP